MDIEEAVWWIERGVILNRDKLIKILKRAEENEKLLKKITFIAGFNITVDSEREEVITILQEYVKNMEEKRILIRTNGGK